MIEKVTETLWLAVEAAMLYFCAVIIVNSFQAFSTTTDLPLQVVYVFLGVLFALIGHTIAKDMVT